MVNKNTKGQGANPPGEADVASQYAGILDPRHRPPTGHLFTLPMDEVVLWADRAERTKRLAMVRKVRIKRAREDFGAFMEYVFADESTGEPFRQQWFHDEWAEAWATKPRVLIIAPRDHGKCLRSLSLLETPTGRRYIKGFPGGQVLALNPATLKIEPADAGPAFENGERDVYRVTLASGRSVTVTDNHPFLKGDQWVECKDLQPGDRVGVMVGCEGHRGTGGDELEAWMLGFIRGNGGVTHGATVSTSDEPCIERIHRYAQARGWRVRSPGQQDKNWNLSGADTGYGPREWLREYGLFGCSAHTKRVPEQVWSWSKQAIAAFVSGYFDADGGMESRNEQMSFSSVHRELLSDVQALLARIGVNGILGQKSGKYKGEDYSSWRLTVRGNDLQAFRAQYSGRSRKSYALLSSETGGYGGGRLDLVPFDVWRKHVTISQRHGRSIGLRFDVKRAMSKAKVQRLADACGSEPLNAIANGDVAWEQVVSIEHAGREMTWGVEVRGFHNHVTDGIITHNTSQIVGRVLFELGRNRNLRIKVVCAADGRAKERLFEIKQHIEYNKRLAEVFPELRADEGAEWSKHKIVVQRTARHRDASVEALGITSSATGGRCDLLIADDVVDSRNALSFPALRKQIKQSWKSDWTNLLEPDSRIWYICTLWHKDDLSHELMNNKAFTTLFYAIGDDFGSLWPEKWPSELLKFRYDEIGSVEFNRGFRNQAIDLDAQIVRPEWIHYADLAKDPAFLEAWDRLVYLTSYDTAVGTKSTNDYFAATALAVDTESGHVWVVDAWHARISIQRQVEMVHREWLKYRPFRVLIEKIGQAVLDEWILNDHPEMAGEIEVTKPRIGKAERLLAVTPLLESGRVTFAAHLDPDGPAWDPSRGSLIHELQDFPVGAHDDLVDSFSQVLSGARRYFLDAWANRGDDVPEVDVTFGDGEDEGEYLW